MLFFFFNDTATTEIYTLSLHDALPIFEDATMFDATTVRRALYALPMGLSTNHVHVWKSLLERAGFTLADIDRKSTRLNSSHANISYAVFCLKKKKQTTIILNMY